MRVFKRHNVERKVSTEEAANRLMVKGYEEITVNAVKVDTALDKMKLEELRTLAQNKEIVGADSLNKKELLELLKDVE